MAFHIGIQAGNELYLALLHLLIDKVVLEIVNKVVFVNVCFRGGVCLCVCVIGWSTRPKLLTPSFSIANTSYEHSLACFAPIDPGAPDIFRECVIDITHTVSGRE